MSIAQVHNGPTLPESLREQLLGFRRRLWLVKTAEALGIACCSLLLAYLAVFALDRLFDVPGWLRGALLLFACVAACAVPVYAYRWIWRRRQLSQLARLLSRKHPRIGDQLLGIIELAASESEQARSRVLCEAAIEHVARDAAQRDFRDAIPHPRHRKWGLAAALPAVVSIVLLALAPAAASNAWLRFLAPWRDTPRYTFAMLESTPDRVVVPHGEPFTLTAKLTENSPWRPREGQAQYGWQEPVSAAIDQREYRFNFPPQLEAGWLDLRIGDAIERVRIEPTLRPELAAVQARVALPDYLGHAEPIEKDARGGSLSVVQGSRVGFTATANRELDKASLNDQPIKPAGADIVGPPHVVGETERLQIRWQDRDGLSGLAPFTLSIEGREDEAPVVSCENLPRQKVVLDSEQLSFNVKAFDDFGVKLVGMEWRGLAEEDAVAKPAQGERLLAAGGQKQAELQAVGAFCAKTLGIEPQPVSVRIFVEDYLPDRKRVYSSEYILYVLDPQQHALWLREQLNKWQRHSLEVRDRELQLYETNKQLRDLSPERLDEPATRKQIEQQAAAERANAARLSNLTASGEDLVAQAARNPEFGVGHLEKWAEMLQVLKDISANRMPSVADLLKNASKAPAMAAKPASPKGPSVGQIRNARTGEPAQGGESKPLPPKPPAPSVVDVESSQLTKKEDEGGKPSASKPKAPRLGLPVTTLAGGGSKKKQEGSSPTATEDVDEAVKQQGDLLAEFEKVSDELNRILANLEGSTFLKRLKAASRVELELAGALSDRVSGEFGVPDVMMAADAQALVGKLGQRQQNVSKTVDVIFEDMLAYYERRRLAKFKTVTDEMKQMAVVDKLDRLASEMPKEVGLSIAQCEYWSDTLDRWAEDLVDATKGGECPGCKSRGSLPPSLVLEAMQILEAEINLRDETRVAEQSRPAVEQAAYQEQAEKLSSTQAQLKQRVDAVGKKLRDLPDGEQDFAPEIGLLAKVGEVMDETAGILKRPDTGAPAIAAETEVIELLLQAKRCDPKSGGGGGSTPGGGGAKDPAKQPALALIGSGANEKARPDQRDVQQASGEAGRILPEEFRAGLDEYFNRLENRSVE